MTGDRNERYESREDEARWHGLLALIPRRTPPPDLTARLLAASRPAWPATRELQPAAASTEVAVTAGVLTGAAMLTLGPVAIVLGFFFLDTGLIVSSVARLFVFTVDWLNAGVSIWDVLSRAARIAAAAISSPAGTILVAGGLLTASLALAGLSRWLPNERGEI